jgi:hypothetical protein
MFDLVDIVDGIVKLNRFRVEIRLRLENTWDQV